MRAKSEYVGVNIQHPISQMIMSGKKVVETRTYPLPEKYVGREMAIIETPGRNGKFKARVIALVKFGPSFQYPSQKAFYADANRHFVDKDSPYKWNGKKKWGWPILELRALAESAPAPRKKGIVFTTKVPL